ncbi:MAG: hypothetical protein RI903_688 [Bacteroidota bacterium]
MKSIYISFLLIFCISFYSCKTKSTFELISSENSGIDFNNQIVDNDTLNILTYEYLYNGSGVGLGDFNGDGLLDVFFSGSQVDSKLYLNQGDFTFSDISKSAGINTKGRWCSGVSVVDINADGLSDIYVSATMKNAAKDRENLLFVNQGIKNGLPTFKEMATEYGINDSGYSEHAAFFDYDRDGDLDLYVLVDVIDEFPALFRPKVTDGSYPNTDRLYRCDWSEALNHPVYTNVSKEAGITIEGFGLGVAICDMNQDNWPDIYVTNDYVSDDLLYINNKNGTFTDQSKMYFKHTSLTAMGNEVGDVNNDGLADVVALDMLPKNTERKKQLAPPNNYQTYLNSDKFGFTYQYMRNTLQLNAGNQADGTTKPFHEISLLAGIAESEWSWCPSLADFDNDGYRDLFVTNGYPRDVTDRDFMLYRANTLQLSSPALMLDQIPVIKISNYAYRNRGDLTFEDVTEKWGLSIPSFSNGAAYGDLDNDGDLDYIVNNINDKAFVYRNNSREQQPDKSHFLRIKFKGDQGNLMGYGAKIEGLYSNGERFYYENTPYRGYLSSVEPVAHIGLGTKRKLKEIRIIWPNDRMQVIKNPGMDKILTVSMASAKEPYRTLFDAEKPIVKDISEELNLVDLHNEYDFIDYNYQNLMPFKLSQLGPGLSAGDVNGDGLEDFFQGGAKFYSGIFYLQDPAGKFHAKPLEKDISLPKKLGEDLGSLLVDFDQDGDLDLYIARGGNEDKVGAASFQDVIYINDGKGNFSLHTTALPVFTESNGAVRASDFDHDGDLDLFVAGRNVPFQYPKSTTSRLLKNESVKGHIKFVDVTQTLARDLMHVGLVCDGIWSDYDGDGWQDLIIAGEFSDIKILKNAHGRLTPLQQTGLEGISGIWTSLASGDFDHDGDMDYVAGNMGKNTLLRANAKQPVDIWHGDLDGNGVYDLFPFVYFQTADGKMASASLFGKDDVHKMLNQTRQRWIYYKDFGKVTQENFFTAPEKEKASKISMQENASLWIENVGDGTFKTHQLPMMAQISAMNGIQVKDINQDGHLDILYVGNNYANEVFIGRYDASNGGILLGNGKGEFTYSGNSGLFVPEDAKSLIAIDLGKKGLAFIASQNRGKMHAFTPVTQAWTRMNVPKGIQGFVYQFKGQQQRVDWTYGSSYLGQSANGQAFLPQGARIIKTF